MELRALIAKVNHQQPLLMILTLKEEFRLRTFIAEKRGSIHVTYSKNFKSESKEAFETIKNLLSGVDGVVITSSATASHFLADFAVQAHIRGRRLIAIQNFYIEIEPSIQTDPASVLKAFSEFSLRQQGSIRIYQVLKNSFEPLLGLFMLLMLSPIFIIAAIAIKLTSPGPVFYSQVRAGKGGHSFLIYKFRSMRTDAEKSGPVWATAKTNDDRLTPIGAFLRACHIDELPQIWNIVKGEISFVGPRPERPVFIEKLREDVPLFELRTSIKPGITGWAQVRQGYANSIDDSRRKLELDLYYILKHSPILDFKIVLATLGVISNGGTEGKKRELALVTQPIPQNSTQSRQSYGA